MPKFFFKKKLADTSASAVFVTDDSQSAPSKPNTEMPTLKGTYEAKFERQLIAHGWTITSPRCKTGMESWVRWSSLDCPYPANIENFGRQQWEDLNKRC